MSSRVAVRSTADSAVSIASCRVKYTRASIWRSAGVRASTSGLNTNLLRRGCAETGYVYHCCRPSRVHLSGRRAAPPLDPIAAANPREPAESLRRRITPLRLLLDETVVAYVAAAAPSLAPHLRYLGDVTERRPDATHRSDGFVWRPWSPPVQQPTT